jgi:hypothetical protein
MRSRFDPARGDIDLVVVTDADLPNDLFDALATMSVTSRHHAPWLSRQRLTCRRLQHRQGRLS